MVSGIQKHRSHSPIPPDPESAEGNVKKVLAGNVFSTTSSHVKSDLNGCHTVRDSARGARLQLRFSYVGELEGVDRSVGKLLERR